MRIDKQAKSMYSRVGYYLELAYKVRHFVKSYQKEFDVIYVTSPNIFLPWATFFFQKRVKSVTKVLEIRDLWPDSVKDIEKLPVDTFWPILKYLEKHMYKKADKVVINNEGFRDHITEMTPKKPVFFLPNAFNNDEVAFESPGSDFQVMYTGNIGHAQSYDQLVEVAEMLEKEKITFNIIAYGANAPEFKAYVDKENFSFINIYGEKTRDECLYLIRQHNVQLSLLKETDVFLNVLPGKVIDGIGSGVPVVTNLGGFTNALINDNEVGIAVEKGSSSEIVDAIKQIRDDKKMENKFRENAKELLNEKFLWENNIKSLTSFIQNK
ncbi:glycosyltransferase family 4 protein [Salinicoccus sp. HZC-1]|uniref:glycosyltransferase family 4 protein n=1 Tax=Salinicoccus sp. HZC-1 TaxID=3385497 RepID=UPI00398AC76B